MSQAPNPHPLWRRTPWLLPAALLLLVIALAAVLDRDRLVLSQFGLLLLGRELAVLGLLVLGQLLLLSRGDIDLGAPAQIALATILVIGLAEAWGPVVAVLASVAVGQVVALSCAVAIAQRRLPAAWVTLVPLVAVPAILPQTSARLAPEPLTAFAMGSAGGLPYPLLVWLALLLLVGLAGQRLASRTASFAAAALCWSVVGLATAGRHGAVANLTPWLVDVGLGIGLAMLVQRPGGTPAVLPGALLAATAAIGQRLVTSGLEPAPSPLAALVLLAGLAAWARRSTDAEDLDLDAIGRTAAGIDHPHGPGADLARLEQPDGDHG